MARELHRRREVRLLLQPVRRCCCRQAGAVPKSVARPLRIALAAGHHNIDGGNETERQQTGQLTHALAEACRAAGIDVRVVTPSDGLGDYPGGLVDVARQVIAWTEAGWTGDVFLELHTQWTPDPSERGVFAIYPDWDGDVDADARDTLGPDIVLAVSEATGLPILGSTGTMSERSTAVGLSGYRLGVFRVTAGIKSTCTRLIVEYGARSSPEDWAIQQQPDFFSLAALATKVALVAWAQKHIGATHDDSDS